ncbi:MAG TPA: DUF4270 family protein [Chitinophagaceae bacterium]|jgi:hypothetical protein
MRGKIGGCLATTIIMVILLQSCYRNDIGFGNLPNNNYTNIVFTDTVSPNISTIVLDSFSTNSTTAFVLGKYKDPYLGIITAKPFFQMTIPAEIVDIPVTAKYDSACFVIHPNKYYYGDTSIAQTIFVNELADPINYTYNTSLYNTTNFNVKPTPLASRVLRIRPNADDSILIRMDDAKGNELFTKLVQKADDVTDDANFQNYFKGVSLSFGDNDTTAVYGLSNAANDVSMRIFYHLTTPFFESQAIDFRLIANTFSYNQILSDRTGTSLANATGPGLKEFPSSQTNNLAFTQYGAGVLMKVTFPSLKGIISTDKIVELQKAELVIKPIGGSYDINKFKLPDDLSLMQTDATNLLGAVVVNNVPPVTDETFGLNTYYKFDITSFVNTLLTTDGNQDEGFFVIQNSSSPNVTRAVMGDSKQPLYNTQLLITVVVINQ